MAESPEQVLIFENLLNISAQTELPWQPFREGVEIHQLYENGKNGSSAALLRYHPGAKIPDHIHTGYEHILILSGSQTDQRGEHKTGTLVVNPPGSKHRLVSESGCIVLIIWEKPVELCP